VEWWGQQGAVKESAAHLLNSSWICSSVVKKDRFPTYSVVDSLYFVVLQKRSERALCALTHAMSLDTNKPHTREQSVHRSFWSRSSSVPLYMKSRSAQFVSIFDLL
jgi:hypothetical protein